MSEAVQFLVFSLERRRYALPLDAVEGVMRAAEVTPLPEAPPTVLGIVDVRGRVLPVLNVRRRFGLPDKAIEPADWFLLAATPRRRLVLVVDESEGVLALPEVEVVRTTEMASGLEPFPGILRREDGLVLIHDLERFLAHDEARTLDDALAGIAPS